MKNIRYVLLAICLFPLFSTADETSGLIKGVVFDKNGSPLPGAIVECLGENRGVLTNAKGEFNISTPKTTISLKISYMGFKAIEQTFTFPEGESSISVAQFEMMPDRASIEEVSVTGKTLLQEVKEQAYNVSVVDAKSLHNTNLDISSALDRASGIKLRSSGGVGSDFNLSINGFSGNQVRFFIDGIPMDNFGSTLQLNNIPIDVAERIEVYKGVVPVGLGADALGGAVNIITNQQQKSSLRASYSYGSFNTHKSSIQGAYIAKSGFALKLNAYQNYSDNNYKMKLDVADINTGAYTRNQTVRRFNDTYHNEVITTDIGVANKSFADELLLGITLGKNYKEIQTGARVASVYGALHKHGNIIMPKLQYRKRDIAGIGLDAKLNANFNLGTETLVDTMHRRYDWYGNYKEYEGPGGERSYSQYQYSNNNGIITAALDYKLAEHHRLSLGNVFNTFNRKGNNLINPSESDKYPRKTQKNITGLSYNYKNKGFDASLLLKHYYQKNVFMQSYSPSGNYGDTKYREVNKQFNFWGYGIATAYFINDNLQVKASFEKSYRMPENNELFGDMVSLQGNNELKPEKSHNYNIGLSKWFRFSENMININTSYFYRNASDFIRARLNNNQIYQVMENLGNTRNEGLEFETRYRRSNRLQAGFNLTYQELRNYTRFEDGSTVESVVYKDRIPNAPYLFGNADASYAFPQLFKKDDRLNLTYNLLYVHEFFLYWPSLGSNKLGIPTQLSHNFAITYNLNKRWQFTLECNNFLDEELFDNFSLQKPGRNFSGKVRCQIF